MADFNGFPTPNQIDYQEFLPICGSDNNGGAGIPGWSKWIKPAGAQMCHMIAIGGGGGGGAAFGNTAGTARGGGGGGGSGGIARLIIPMFLLPDELYVQAGFQGAGAVVANTEAGSNGGISYVSVGPYPDGNVSSMTNASNLYLMSSAIAAQGGGAGTNSIVGPGGAGGTISVITSQIAGGYTAFWFANAGVVGSNGGAVAGGAGVAANNALTVGPCGGGAGGGGSTSANFAGGAVGAVGKLPAVPAGVTNGGNGGNGLTLRNPFMSCGGGGGGASNAGTGGNGGNGGWGSGGGGSGAGTQQGGGGHGGSGVVIIISW